MARQAVITVRLSEMFQPLLLAALDLLQEVEESDPALVTDAVASAATRFRSVVEEGQGTI